MNLFTVSDINYTPFEYSISHLNLSGFQITNQLQKADILVGKFLPKKTFLRGLKFLKIYGNKTPLLIWSAEPRDFPATKAFIPRDLLYPEIYVMNMQVGGVYRHPGSYYGFQAKPTEYMSYKELKNKFGLAVGIMKYVSSPIIFLMDNKNVDLISVRQKLTLLGHQRGLVEIYGKGWAKGLSKSSSGHQPGWVNDKLGILKGYKFNICLENTAYPLYISEKIWQSVMGRCLPIYSSYNSSIYEIFSKNSFLDIQDFANFDDLYSYIQSISDSEYIERYNLCVEAMNKFCKSYDLEVERKWITEQLLDKLRFISQLKRT